MIKKLNPAIFSGKKVLYICTKQTDYIRMRQEIRLLSQYASGVKVIGSDKGNYLLRVISVVKQLFKDRHSTYDVCYVSFLSQLIIPFLKRKQGTILVNDFFVSVYDTLVNDRKKIRGPLKSVLHLIDSVTLKRSDIIVTDTKEHAKYFSSEFKIPESRMQVLYLEADQSIYHPMTVNKNKEWENKYLVLYFGSILPLQGVEVIMKAAELLQNMPDIAFLLIGPVKEKKSVQNIVYINWLAQDKLAAYIAQSDLCLAGHFNSEIMKASRTIPGKAYIYKAMEKPMILGDNAANRELFSEDQDGIYFVRMGSPAELARKILDVYRENRANYRG